MGKGACSVKTTDERAAQALRRASAIQLQRRRRRQRAVAWGGGAACIAILALASLAVSSAGAPNASTILTVGEEGLEASVFAGSSMLGYFIVGFLGAALGVALTVLAYRLGPRGDTCEGRLTEAGELANRAKRDGSDAAMSMSGDWGESTRKATAGGPDEAARRFAWLDEDV